MGAFITNQLNPKWNYQTNEVEKNDSNPSKSSQVSITSNEVKQIIQTVKWIPSGDNCQPFTFKWKDPILEIHLDPKRSHHALNSNGISNYLSLGFAINYLEIAARKLGYSTQISLNETLGVISPDKVKDPFCLVKFLYDGQKEDTLFNCLKERATDRRHYKGGDIDMIYAHLKDLTGKGIYIHCQTSKNKKLVKLLSETEQTIFKWKRATHDLYSWFRLSPKEVQNSSDGLPYQNLGLNMMDVFCLRFFRKYMNLHWLTSKISAFKFKMDFRRVIASSAGFITFSTQSSRPEDLVKLGNVACQAWLKLTKEQYSLQPLSQSSLFISELVNFPTPTDLPKSWNKKLMNSWSSLKSLLNSDGSQKMMWTFRVGKSNGPLPFNHRTKRRETDEILEVVY